MLCALSPALRCRWSVRDVDTDQIIPSDWLKQVERTGFAKGLFGEWRDDRDFVLNQPEYAGATILVAGPELRDRLVPRACRLGPDGLRRSPRSSRPASATSSATTAPSRGSSPSQVDAATGAALLAAVKADPTLEITVDVERRLVSAPAAGIEAPFPLDDFTRHRLLEGLDDIGLTPAPHRRGDQLRAGPAVVAALGDDLTGECPSPG